ncbi:BTAD domain-containing putative transcriptional regulator [Gemmatimonas phototrophica]|uniref:Bacterial transcriptional activator domain-containing protein n=1 Tax=Gemmatimonas phototrophica TaxID=1379270 RepID=A0A143BNS7_9BACT|nr:BTAD domain-containing putative transcriptional regulator [Gemmatimonas phototrophica]AMW06160.1 hypothetical protein GEMMAAP_17950 [Gemmatimonas phototrophica]
MISLRTLGGVAVTLLDGRTPAPGALQPRRLAMLAFVARSGALGISRDRIVSTFWPDSPEEAGRRAVTQALSALRSGLDAPELLLGTQELRLNAEVVTCDLWEFERAIAERRYEQAAALYTGPFLDGFRLPNAPDFERWLDETRRTLADRHDVALERLARAADGRGETLAAAGWWRRRLASDPLSARITAEVVRALVASGDAAGAQGQARVYASLVRQELGVEPDPLVESALQQAQREAPPRTERPSSPATVLTAATAPPPPAVAERRPDAASSPLPTTAPEAAPTPQGRWLRFGVAAALSAAALLLVWRAAVSNADRLEHAHVVDPSRVTSDDGLELDPAISPSGQQIAYAAGQPGRMRLLLRQRDGGRAVELVPGQSGDQRRPRWSPDGARLLYQANRAIWMVPALGGAPRVVVEAPADSAKSAAFPTWSPDGTSLAYVVGDSLVVSALDGTARRVVMAEPGLHSPAWSPNDRWIAVVAGNRDFLYGVVGNLAPSALLLVPARCDIQRSPCPSTTVGEPTALHLSPEWRDSRQLLYVSQQGGSRDLFGVEIDERGHTAGAPVRLTSGTSAASVSVATDGVTLAYSVLQLQSNVWSTPVATPGAPVRVTNGAQIVEGLDVTPDGRWLAFDADRSGQQDIFVLPLANGRPGATEAARVVDAPRNDFHPTWSADGQWLSYYTFVDGQRRASVVPAQGGVSQLLLTGPSKGEEYSPVWSADGRAVVYWRWLNGRYELFEVPRTGERTFGSERQLTTRGGFGPSFTNDGRMAYFVSTGEVWLMPAERDESRARKVYPVATAAAPTLSVSSGRVTPDGTRLIVKANDGQGDGYWAVPIDGGRPRLIVRVDDPERPSPRLEFASDGRHVFYTRLERSADVWSARIARR